MWQKYFFLSRAPKVEPAHIPAGDLIFLRASPTKKCLDNVRSAGEGKKEKADLTSRLRASTPFFCFTYHLLQKLPIFCLEKYT